MKAIYQRSSIERLLQLEGKCLMVRMRSGRYIVSFAHCEVKNGGFLKSCDGVGDTVEDAANEYMAQISGKTLVFNAESKNREEVICLF